MRQTINKYLAVVPPRLDKIEAQMSTGGLALNASRQNVLEVELVMDYSVDGNHLHAGKDKVILQGDAGAQTWSKRVFVVDGKQFCLVPEGQVIGFVKG